jgi:hypothetical protein
VLVTETGALALADPRTGRVRWRRSLGNAITGAVQRAGVVWAEVIPPRRLRAELVGLDAASGRTVARLELDELGAVDLADVGGLLWLTTVGGRIVVLRPPS